MGVQPLLSPKAWHLHGGRVPDFTRALSLLAGVQEVNPVLKMKNKRLRIKTTPQKTNPLYFDVSSEKGCVRPVLPT